MTPGLHFVQKSRRKRTFQIISRKFDRRIHLLSLPETIAKSCPCQSKMASLRHGSLWSRSDVSRLSKSGGPPNPAYLLAKSNTCFQHRFLCVVQCLGLMKWKSRRLFRGWRKSSVYGTVRPSLLPLRILGQVASFHRSRHPFLCLRTPGSNKGFLTPSRSVTNVCKQNSGV